MLRFYCVAHFDLVVTAGWMLRGIFCLKHTPTLVFFTIDICIKLRMQRGIKIKLPTNLILYPNVLM